MSNEPALPANFIRHIIREDLESGKVSGEIITRFPPEPNGYLHIGHAKSICLNFGLAAEFEGRCHLRFDDTNPEKEDIEYVEAIKRDVSWLGFDWGEHQYFASDYYERLYQAAEELIEKGLAYVDSQSADEVRNNRGTLTETGTDSPYRGRSVDENLKLFGGMRAGKFGEGEHVLRAKIDMASPNLNMRDPILYRVQKVSHYRTADDWCIYPMYDFAHPISDALEGITHSVCTLEFEDHRPLYDWVVENVSLPSRPYQYEFARLNLTYTVMSKRKLLQLVKEGHVNGWDDPRMPTISGLRRRGFTPASIRTFCERIGVGKSDSLIGMEVLEECVREDLNEIAPRRMAVLDPLKVTITNYPEGQVEEFEGANHPKKPEMGMRKVPFSKTLYIERGDFMEDPPKKFFRLAPGREVRFRFAYFIRCDELVRDPQTGEVVELLCSYDPETRGGSAPDGRKVKGTIHWVSAEHAIDADVRLYDRLFKVPNPGSGADADRWLEQLNSDSLQMVTAKVEPLLDAAQPGEHFQFERVGYFCCDQQDGERVFNRITTLRDTWAKLGEK
ncbi:MAG: glutamine--tRNA ligase [Desulfuromonas sp.]|nr:MAG: glutamine--tRNA ligase [Desulfuromonas sp.]